MRYIAFQDHLEGYVINGHVHDRLQQCPEQSQLILIISQLELDLGQEPKPFQLI